jgi:arginine-tRNA-protein transferase
VSSADFCPWPALPPPRGIQLTVMPEHPCSYLPGRVARNRAFLAERMPPQLYHELMNAGFRRSGTFLYQPICSGCRACEPIRVPVATFVPSKSQRRVWRKNQDLQVAVGLAEPTEEKFELYGRYVRERHNPEREEGEEGEEDRESFLEFLYHSPVETIEFTYRRPADQKLIGVGLCDICAQSLSSVYFYFDPIESKRRGLGTFSSLQEIAWARKKNIPYYYLGYFVRGCAAMSYKANFAPNELLHPDGVWRAS